MCSANTGPAKSLEMCAPIEIKGSQTFEVDPSDVFPIVEGIFGPLRIPLPRTPVCLDREYGGQWRHTRVCKRVSNHGKGKEERIPGDSVRRCAWPSVPLVSCEHLRCGYSGAGPRASPGDMPWRFHEALSLIHISEPTRPY